MTKGLHMARSSTARKAGGKGSTKPEFREPEEDNDDIVIEDERDEDEDESDDEDDESDDDDEELGEGGKKALRAERQKSRQLERELRAEKRKNRTSSNDDKGKPRGRSRSRDDEDEDDPKPTDREARIETRLKRSSLSAELIASGVSKSNARLLVGQAKLSKLGLDDDDEVDPDDLEDMVEDLKDEYPDLFGGKSKGRDEDDEDPADRRRRLRQRGNGGGDRRPGRERAPRSSADQLAAAITGGGRR